MSEEAYHEKYPIAYWDWRAWSQDAGVRSVSLSARGLWFELLGMMRKWRNYGILCTRAGFPMKLGEIAEAVNAPVYQIKPLLDELEKAGVFSRSKRGAIFCRRMKREAPVLATISQLSNQGGLALPPFPPSPPYTPPSPLPLHNYNKNIVNAEKDKPSLTQVVQYGKRVGADEKLCRKFFAYYANSNWRNKHGKEIEWRQSLKNWSAESASRSQQSSPSNSCESPPARFEDSKDQAWVALNHARMASESVLMLALATFSESNIRLALGDLNDISLEKRVNEAYQKINGQVKS
jgi:hypothetical protein